MFFFFNQKTAYEMRISDWSSDVCSSDLVHAGAERADDRVGALHRTVDSVGIAESADRDGDVIAPAGRHLGRVADIGGHGVAVGAELVDDLGADAAGGAEHGHVHGSPPECGCGG